MAVRLTVEVTFYSVDVKDIPLAEQRLADALRGAKFLSLDVEDALFNAAIGIDPELPDEEAWQTTVEIL